MTDVVLEQVTKSYGKSPAVDHIDLAVRDGELVSLLGPSGCGKTTTLRMIAGFTPVTSGRIRIGNRDITDLPPYRRNTGMVFQSYALFPHLTVTENIAFGLEMRRMPRTRVRQLVGQALEAVQMEGFDNRLPKQLSGGQQQRVALARALVIEPDVLLLDEPLSNLDAKLRNQVRLEIRRIQQRLGLTTIFVTHDQEEALSLSDRLVVMNHGRIEQIGSPEELYERPRTLFVAGFVGKANIINGRIVGVGRFRAANGEMFWFSVPGTSTEASVLAIRPEKVSISREPIATMANHIAATVEFATYLGPVIEYGLRLSSGDTLIAHHRNDDGRHQQRFVPGDAVFAQWHESASLVL